MYASCKRGRGSTRRSWSRREPSAEVDLSNFISPIPGISNRFPIIVSAFSSLPLFDVAVHKILNLPFKRHEAYIFSGLGRIGDQVSADPEDPANYDLFAGLEIIFKWIGSLITDPFVP